MKLEKLKPGMIVYDVHKTQMGNTTMRTVGVWPVHIVSVDVENQTVEARWNHNPVQKYRGRAIGKWRAKEPLLITGRFGCARLATREEIKAHKAAINKATP